MGLLCAVWLGVGCRPSVQQITIHNNSSHNIATGEVAIHGDTQAFKDLRSHDQIVLRMAPKRKGAIRLRVRFDNDRYIDEEASYIEPTVAGVIELTITDERRMEWRQKYLDK
jgi:hypothetical protein